MTIHAFGRALAGQPPVASVLPKSLLGLCWWLASQTNRTYPPRTGANAFFGKGRHYAARSTQPFFLERTVTAAWPRRVVAPINALRCAAELESDALHGLARSVCSGWCVPCAHTATVQRAGASRLPGHPARRAYTLWSLSSISIAAS